MAFVVGYASLEEVAELESRGWKVEEASEHGLIGQFMEPPPEGEKAVVVFVDRNLFDMMNGPDWEGGS
jgi:hypothetical protein